MRFGVIQFPGSTCDYDCFDTLKDVLEVQVDFIWHTQTDIGNYHCIILPGGFSYGDYLRVGAIARFSPVIKSVKEFAGKGGLVLGICNGFQILLESGLLPGVLIKNKCLHFLCHYVQVKVENNDSPYTSLCKEGQVLKIPIAHGEGNFYADENTLAELIRNNQIVLRYCNETGEIHQNANPNGSIYNIASICNKERNVLGMMPHPERCVENCLGSSDGRYIFNSIIDFIKKKF